MKIAVVGAGAMGRWAVKELGISPEVGEIVVGDVDPMPQGREAPAPSKAAFQAVACVFRAKPNTDSTPSRTGIPRQAEH